MTCGECVQGKSFVDTTEDTSVAERPLIKAHASIQLRQVADTAHVTNWFVQQRQCSEKLRNAINWALSAATSLTDRSDKPLCAEDTGVCLKK